MHKVCEEVFFCLFVLKSTDHKVYDNGENVLYFKTLRNTS